MTLPAQRRRVVVGITGASGAVYGIRTLQICREIDDVEVHLVISRGSRSTIHAETGMSVSAVADLADVVYSNDDLGAAISSGSFTTAGMIVAPCSIKTLSAIANSYADGLISRSADVALKERRPLVLMVRETPLHRGHLRLLSLAADSGAVIYPPVPSFYTRPGSLDEMVDHTCRRALQQLGVTTPEMAVWRGMDAGGGFPGA
ncbi:UbiX family flavin prenyltransferase [Compostimonas suwonensis]|uniref:Flavin prenyltransferase UbiX n=1 Tax=Compostimonas suwonensis TaxID=1048394 RepID=A0A2M9BZS8_9MICO|nr:UbiX family flavin prenyltransferase [Compostimonas suwonensis]PJJ63599.1 4-hydroxy-3-polyprenylbenzoate decarboxylase [Compostimonas suwonensis]